MNKSLIILLSIIFIGVVLNNRVVFAACSPVGAACNDNQACTYNDKCLSDGSCQGIGYGCGCDPCHYTSCDGNGGCYPCQLKLDMKWCEIDYLCVYFNQSNPVNPCQKCYPSISLYTWTNDDSVRRACYTGSVGTKDIGLCHGGIEYCSSGSWSGTCSGQVTDTLEVCNLLDDDCDSISDEGDACSLPCTSTTEICDGIDNDCDGSIDEGFHLDADGIPDCFDRCPNSTENDIDNDNICGNEDNCPTISNPKTDWIDTNGMMYSNKQRDFDLDGIGDACDNCPYSNNPFQEDTNMDGTGDACGPNHCNQNTKQGGCEGPSYCDGKNDPLICVATGGIVAPRCTWEPVCNCIVGYDNSNNDWSDGCEDTDSDADGIGDTVDNCPATANRNQKDTTDIVRFNFSSDGTMVSSTIGADSYGQNLANTFYVPNPNYQDQFFEVGNLIDGSTRINQYSPDIKDDFWRMGGQFGMLIVKMPEFRLIDKILLDNHIYYGDDYGNINVHIEFSSDSTNGFDGGWFGYSGIYTGTGYGPQFGPNQYIYFEPTSQVTAQYFRVRITRESGSYLTLNEIGVYGHVNDGAGDDCDNCPLIPNSGQLDTDGDGLGNTCDNCPSVFNPLQEDDDGDNIGVACDPCPNDPVNDMDGDGVCESIDNCPGYPNPNQNDINQDGEGDLCDCNDGLYSIREYGPDCGGICGPACPDYGNCYPILYHGEPGQVVVGVPVPYKINIVLVPNGDDYRNNMDLFLSRSRELIVKSLFAQTRIRQDLNKINVYYVNRFGGDVNVDNGDCSWDFPDHWKDDCPYAMVGAILHENDCRDYANDDKFSSEPDSYRTFLHELSHSVFLLADEYDDEPSGCGTSYSADGHYKNIWESIQACERESVNPDNCFAFTDCNDRMWKSDPDGDMMECGSTNVCPYYDDCTRQVDYTFDQVIDPPFNDTTKSIVLYLNTNQGKIILLNTSIVYGGAPLHLRENGTYLVKVLETNGNISSMFYTGDPKYFHFESGPSEYRDNVDFDIVLPFESNETPRKVEIFNKSNDNVMTLDLGEEIIGFCTAHPDDPECLTMDSDDDGFKDIEDCNPLDSSIYPGAVELCNGKDEDCDSISDEDLTQDCGTEECKGIKTCILGEWSECNSKGRDIGVCALCNTDGIPVYDETQDSNCASTVCPSDGCGVDLCDKNIWGDYPETILNECSGIYTCTQRTCEGTAVCGPDIDDDKYSPQCGDCDDTDSSVYFIAPELCDNKDNNCNFKIDETICGDQTDSDCDKVNDCTIDKCPNTVPWYAERGLKPNHYDSSNWNIVNAFGCACSQVLYCKPGKDEGEFKFGCSAGTKKIWETQTSWALDCQMNGKMINEGITKPLFANTDGDIWPDILESDKDGDGIPDANDDMIEDRDPIGDPDYGVPDWHPKSTHKK